MKHAQLALAHNGQLVNAAELRREIMGKGVGLSTQSDSELMIQMLCQPPPEPNNETEDKPDWPARIKFLMTKTKLAYSLVIMSEDRIHAVRDPFGLRPLFSGEQDGRCAAYVVASESCAFWSIGADYFRDVEPGEIVEITKEGIQTAHVVPRSPNQTSRLCVLEYVYFARPDSILGGQMVYTARMECGRQLAKQAPVEADVVTGVPESATAAAFGFAEESGIPYTEVFSKNRYVGRTFIQPTKTLRQLAVRKKFGPITDNFKGKRIVLIDDSIVRGTTIASIIRLLKEAGASEVHIRIASPPLHNPCNMGINIPTKEELIANTSNAEQLAKKLGADSLVYLTVENLTKSVTMHSKRDRKVYGHCTACFTGEYPAELEW
ncbi:amidophosphoribosyltransferase [Caerostris darwini]|uniref:Amidophosphoribosyltransferase n=1 Tax=Caerostris darwini TaxID=1538125 RepID=A0AAV4S894_9ARAC|nr:amidophosphoribosyltransferase [Caerostris darwini]